MRVERLRVGDRIELEPATDLWMQGARYGEIVDITGFVVSLVLDKLSDRVTRVRDIDIMRRV